MALHVIFHESPNTGVTNVIIVDRLLSIYHRVSWYVMTQFFIIISYSKMIIARGLRPTPRPL